MSDRNSRYGEKSGFILRRCLNCEAVFVWPMPRRLEETYEKEYFKNTEKKHHGYADYEKDKEPMRGIFISYLKKFEGLAREKKIFDVGTATGYFLDLAKARGWRTAGIEISPYASLRAKEKGHDIICSETLKGITDNEFDVVTMWDVLEHLRDPVEYLRDINKIIRTDGGFLFINTVRRDSLLAKLLGIHWHLIVPPEHLFYFSEKSLKIALDRTGFEIVWIGRVSKKFSLSYIFKTLYNWQNIRVWRILERYFNTAFWRRFSLTIDLRDNISILARKM